MAKKMGMVLMALAIVVVVVAAGLMNNSGNNTSSNNSTIAPANSGELSCDNPPPMPAMFIRVDNKRIVNPEFHEWSDTWGKCTGNHPETEYLSET
jgi:hypothetical protein